MVNQNNNLFAPLIQAVVPQKSEWRQLFNGKYLTGWKHVGPGDQYVEDGLIKSHGGMGLLYWPAEKYTCNPTF